jgi:DNA replication protein DnaC
MKRSRVSQRHLLNIETRQTDAGQESMLKHERQMRGSGYTLVLCGGPGRGKTHLACRMIAERVAAPKPDGKFDECRYGSLAEHLEWIKSSYDGESKLTEQEAMKALYAPVLLVIDEIHDALTTEYAGRMLREIVDRRYRDMRDTVLVTNWPVEDIGAKLPPQIVSRASECGGVIDCSTWKDWRSRA